MQQRDRSEAAIEASVLALVGQRPGLWITKNEVGLFYRGSAVHALRSALAPFGPHAQRAAVDAIAKHRLTVGQVGSPDLYGAYHGRFFGWEMKTPVGVVSEEQETWHAAARGRGCRVDVIRSEEEALSALSEMEREWSR
jgi:hypothetical protein